MRKADTPIQVEKLRREVNKLVVLNCELASLNSKAKVYKQHGSGQVLFLVDKANIISECKGFLNDAKLRLETAEKNLAQQ